MNDTAQVRKCGATWKYCNKNCSECTEVLTVTTAHTEPLKMASAHFSLTTDTKIIK